MTAASGDEKESGPGRGVRIVRLGVIALSVLLALAAIRTVGNASDVDAVAGSAMTADSVMAAGFLLLFCFLLGGIARELNLPKITGYLLGGLLVGPEVLGHVTSQNLADLSIANAFAIGVIAFVAGAELRPQLIRERGRTILRMLVVEVGVVFIVVGGAAILLREFIPFLAGLPFAAALALALVFASIATVHSPAVTIALLDEQKAAGPVTSTTLGIVVAADVLVVLLASLSIGAARGIIDGGGFDVAFLGTIAWELMGAIVAGAVLGTLIDGYLRFVGARLIIFVIFIVFLGNELAQVLHVEYMLFMLATGFFVENVSPVDGEPLIEAIGKVSVPAYVLFFSLAGGSIHLAELAQLWPVALGAVLLRAASIWFGCRVGARWSGAEPVVAQYAWMGLVSQAGVALGLATVAARALGDAGAQIQTMFLAMIAIHELVGPVLFRAALARSGEIGRASDHSPMGQAKPDTPAPVTA